MYDLEQDPHERENLAPRAEGRAALAELGAIADARWDLPALRAEVLASQRQRRLVARALATGTITRWDHMAPDDAPDRYISSGRDFWGALEQARLAAPDERAPSD